MVRSEGIGRDQNVSRGPWRRVWSESILVRLRSSTHSTDQNQRSAAGLPPSTANVDVWQKSVQVHREHKCGLLVHLEGFTKVRVHFLGQSRRVAMDWQQNFNASSVMARVFRMSRPVSVRVLSNVPLELPMIGIVGHEMKWYSCNNRRLWCCRAAKAEAVDVCMSSVDTAFLHGLTTQTDGLSVTFLKPLQCMTCHNKFVNRKVCAATNVSEWRSFCDSLFSWSSMKKYIV